MLSVVHSIGFSLSESAPFLPLLFCFIAIIYYCLAAYSAIAFLAQFTFQPDPDFHPSISILKPLCGLDHNTYKNLASFCVQDYPNYQIVFGVQDVNDPVIAIVKQLMDDFPAIDLRLVVSDRAIGTNLKISNLANAATEARYPIWLLSDDDIRVDSDYLMTVVQPLRHSTVGVVTCLYRSLTQGWIAAFEGLGTSTEMIPTVLVSRKLEGMSFGIGATIVIRQSVLAAIGGFPAVANYLQDDFHLGRMPVQAGYQVVLSRYVVSHVSATEHWADFLHHQSRWNRGIRASQPLGYAGQIFTFGTIASLLFLLTMQGSAFSWIVLSITWCFRLTVAWLVGVKVLHDPVVKRFWWLVPLSDLVRFTLWCYGFVSNNVEWRDRQLQLTKGGKLIALNAEPSRLASRIDPAI